MKMIQNRKWIAGPIIIGLTTVGTMGVLRAQPDDNIMAKGDNPIARQKGGKKGNRAAMRQMTPEQREQAKAQRQEKMQQGREENLRKTLTEAGFTDKATQDAVVDFANDQDDNRDDKRDATRQLSKALRQNVGDGEIAALVTQVREETQTAKDQRETALKALDDKIGYTKKPRLEAVLILAGVTGENAGGRGGFGGKRDKRNGALRNGNAADVGA